MKRTTIRAPAACGAALALFVVLAPTALAGDAAQVDGETFGQRVKFGASGQVYTWESGC